MNEVAAVTRRLIAGLLSAPTIVGAPAAIKAAFDSTLAMKQAVGKLGAVIAAREQIDADLSMTCPGRFLDRYFFKKCPCHRHNSRVNSAKTRTVLNPGGAPSCGGQMARTRWKAGLGRLSR
jgi:hypothetical protein